MTRPDILYAVRAVTHHSHNPTETLWKAVLKIMAYLHGNRLWGLIFVPGSKLDSTVSSDAGCVDEWNNRRSVSGMVVTLGGQLDK